MIERVVELQLQRIVEKADDCTHFSWVSSQDSVWRKHYLVWSLMTCGEAEKVVVHLSLYSLISQLLLLASTMGFFQINLGLRAGSIILECVSSFLCGWFQLGLTGRECLHPSPPTCGVLQIQHCLPFCFNINIKPLCEVVSLNLGSDYHQYDVYC